MVKNKFTTELEMAIKEDKQDTGGKAYFLSEMVSLGLKIPRGFSVNSNAYKEFFDQNDLSPKILQLLSTVHFEKHETISQVSTHITKLILEKNIPDEIKNDLIASFQEIINDRNAINLINQKTNRSITSIDTINKFLSSVKELWADNFSPENIIENKTKLAPPVQLLVLEKISAQKKGVIFTNDFKNEEPEIALIAEKIKRHFHIPHMVNFIKDLEDIYITDIKPLTNLQNTKLVLVRHGQSVWNARGLWTGWTDVDLSDKGRDDARDAGAHLRDIKLDLAYTSVLKRAKQTLTELLKSKGQIHVPVKEDKALNERDYGDYTGKNKWDVKKEVGEEKFQSIRRSWDYILPGGESLKDVYHRVVPYYETEILPKLKAGKNVIISAHGNSLRALVKHLEDIADDKISELEIAVGEVYVYTLDEDGNIIKKEIRNQKENTV